MRSLHADTCHCLADVEEVLHGEIVCLLLETAEFAYLFQLLADEIMSVGETDIVDHLLAQRTEAVLFQKAANITKSYLLFKVIRINHGAKVQKKHLSCKKSLKNLFKWKNMSTFAPAFKTRSTGEMVEWSITVVLKTTVLRGTGGSNPSLSAKRVQ